jgi:hypothetical protein
VAVDGAPRHAVGGDAIEQLGDLRCCDLHNERVAEPAHDACERLP